jgi:hypothetical protein
MDDINDHKAPSKSHLEGNQVDGIPKNITTPGKIPEQQFRVHGRQHHLGQTEK